MIFGTILDYLRAHVWRTSPISTFHPAPEYPTIRAGREESMTPTIVRVMDSYFYTDTDLHA